MADFKYFDRIEAYVNKTMPAEERSSFEAALTQDEVLQKEYRAYQATLIASDILGLQVLEEMSTKQGGRIVSMRRWWMMAASILLIALSGVVVFANLNYRSTQLFSEAMDATSIDLTDLQDQELQNAWQAFQQADYNTTLQLLSPSRDEGGFISTDAQLLYAFTLIKQGNAQAAISLLSGMSQENTKAKWYLAIAYLQNDQKKAARPLLESISSDPSNPFADQADRLLQKMNAIWSRFAF